MLIPNFFERLTTSYCTVDISYVCRYFEENGRKRNPYSDRHTGVYHLQSRDIDLFVILQPTTYEKSVVDQKIIELSDGSNAAQSELQAICDEPMRIHSLVFRTYLGLWRPYLRHLGNGIGEEVREECMHHDLDCSHQVQNNSAMILGLDTSETPEKSFRRVQTLRNLCDKVMIAKAYCAGDVEVVRCLLDLVHPSSNLQNTFRTEAARLVGFVESAEVLQGRITNALDLVRLVSQEKRNHSDLRRLDMLSTQSLNERGTRSRNSLQALQRSCAI